jgi:NTE family protein
MLFLFLETLSFPQIVFSQQQDSTQVGTRPKLGLVLSGGGAKGFAHVGALKVFEEAGLHFDYIGGTSIGSIIGGLYAVGYSPEMMNNMIRSQNWEQMLTDRIPRRYIPIEERYNSERFIATFPVAQKKIQLRSAFYKGHLINLLLARLTNQVYHVNDFNNLPIPFLCVTTDLETGEAIVQENGILHQRIKASMSIPGYFEPMKIDDKVLVDGGLANNFPVDEIRQKGADIIVGITLKSDLYKGEQLTSAMPILDQILSLTIKDEAETKPCDIYIQPELRDYNMMSFNDYDSLFAIGERAARAIYPELKKLADSLNAIEPYDNVRKRTTPLDSIYISVIQYSGLKRVSRSFVEGTLQIMPRSYVTINELEEGLMRLYGCGFFSDVDYHFIPDYNGAILAINLVEQAVAILGAGIHYDTDYHVALLLNGTFKNLLSKGSRLFIDLSLGENPLVSASFISDKGKKLGFGVKFTGFGLKFNQYDKKIIDNSFKANQYKLDAFFQATNKDTRRLRIGSQFEFIDFTSLITPVENDKYKPYVNFFVNYFSDRLNHTCFSTQGSTFEVTGRFIVPIIRKKNKEGANYENAIVVRANFMQNIPITRRNTLKIGFNMGITIGNGIPPYHHQFMLGGQSTLNYFDSFVPFVGMRFIEKTGNQMTVGNLAWQYRASRNLYVTLKIDVGYIENSFSKVLKDPKVYIGTGLTLGYDSFIGPLQLTLMGSNSNKKMLGFINLGYWF